jgi:ribonuclease Z
MKICFIGVGEAFDEQYPNTCVLVSTQGPTREQHVLLDCGFTAPAAYYRHAPQGVRPDVIWVSHFHGDHFLGLPLLLLRFWEEERSKPLTIVGQVGIVEKVWAALDLAYPGFRDRIGYPVVITEVYPETEMELLGLRWTFASNNHSAGAPCLSVRLDHRQSSLVYSGDGKPTSESERLAFRAGLIIQEAYGLGDDKPGHGSVDGGIAFARRTQTQKLALVHVNRMVRAKHGDEIRTSLSNVTGFHAFMPEPGTTVDL